MDRTQAFRKRLENSGFEIWFGVAFDYEKRIAVWFRYSALHRPGRPPRSAVWLSFFDQKNGTNVVRTSGFDQGIVQKGETYSVGHSSFSQNHVLGTIDDIHWNLACTHAHEAESHVPEFVMNSPLVKTKSIVVSPFCGFSGIVKIGKRELNLNASGCYTHIWGTERVPELYWCFVPQFDNTDIGMEFFAVRPKPFLPLIKFITIRSGDPQEQGFSQTFRNSKQAVQLETERLILNAEWLNLRLRTSTSIHRDQIAISIKTTRVMRGWFWNVRVNGKS